jgi:hypothetical protein
MHLLPQEQHRNLPQSGEIQVMARAYNFLVTRFHPKRKFPQYPLNECSIKTALDSTNFVEAEEQDFRNPLTARGGGGKVEQEFSLSNEAIKFLIKLLTSSMLLFALPFKGKLLEISPPRGAFAEASEGESRNHVCCDELLIFNFFFPFTFKTVKHSRKHWKPEYQTEEFN